MDFSLKIDYPSFAETRRYRYCYYPFENVERGIRFVLSLNYFLANDFFIVGYKRRARVGMGAGFLSVFLYFKRHVF